MHHIEPSVPGHYLRVWDVDVEEDTKDIFMDIRNTPPPPTTSSTSSSPTSAGPSTPSSDVQTLRRSSRASTRASTSSVTSTSSAPPTITIKQQARHLIKIIPPNPSTHDQEAYNHVLVDGDSKNGPTYAVTTIEPKDMVGAYENLIRGSNLATAASLNLATTATARLDPSQHTFVPSIQTSSIPNPTLQQHLHAIGTKVQQHYQRHVSPLHHEVLCDHVFDPPLDGFGVRGLQLYLKHGTSVTWLHDEILWHGALNYMMSKSLGVSLWIAIGVNDYKQMKSVMDMHEILMRTDLSVMKIGELLNTLIDSGTRVEYVFQRPGQVVSSPPGNGAAHIVIADGLFMSQLAWNSSFTLSGGNNCLSFWGERQSDREFGHIALDNSSMATRTVLPLYTMETQGYTLGLMDKVIYYRMMIDKLHKHKQGRMNVSYVTQPSLEFCGKCFNRQDWIKINGKCIHCYMKSSHVSHLVKVWSLPPPVVSSAPSSSPSTS